MFLLLYGEDGFGVTERLAGMRDEFRRTSDPQGLNMHSFESGTDNAADLLAAVLTVPFLSGGKFIVARGYLSVPKADQTALLDLLGRIPEETVLVFVEMLRGRDLSKSPLFDILSRQAGSREYPAVTSRNVASVFVSALRSRGVSLEFGAEAVAASLLPADSWQIFQEAEKVAAYAAARGTSSLSPEVLNQIISGGRDESILSFLDACLDGNPKSAAGELVTLMDGGMSEHQVIAAVSRQVRTLVAVRDFIDRGMADKSVIARELKLHPYPVEKAMRAVRATPSAILRRLFGLCLDTESALKTGASGREAVELLAVRLAVVSR
jgi:DNA polymerase-3 subunit delta